MEIKRFTSQEKINELKNNEITIFDFIKQSYPHKGSYCYCSWYDIEIKIIIPELPEGDK
jgi:hypothetical protein